MDLVWTIVIGFVVGLIAKMITPGRDPSGFFITAALGIAGALLATFIGRWSGYYAAGQPAGFIASLIGAVVVLLLYHLVFRNRAIGGS
ncbi:MAG: GlsB/YeaQ/YmgE family stress response membrane protein [Dokdonella sp.]